MDRIKEAFEKWYKKEFEQDYEDVVEESKCFPEVAQMSHIEDSYTAGHKEGEVVGRKEGRKEALEDCKIRAFGKMDNEYINTELKKLEGE